MRRLGVPEVDVDVSIVAELMSLVLGPTVVEAGNVTDESSVGVEGSVLVAPAVSVGCDTVDVEGGDWLLSLVLVCV